MAGFSLKKGTDTFDFDVFGNVTKGGNRVGTWTTSKDNKIVVNKPDGTQDSFTVSWTFNQDNHLCLGTDGQQPFDFHSVSGNRPFYATNNAVLRVRPDKNHTFGFDLRGEWDLDSHILSITFLNGAKSTIDGFLQDPKSRFMYHFFDKKNLGNESILGFVGGWEFSNKDGAPMMNFKYKREDGSEDTFSLPKALAINKGFNQFLYQYDKQGHSFGIQFVGLLQIGENFQITYAIDRQVQSGVEQVAATTFTLGATFVTKNNATGDIEFTVKKTDGSAGTTTLGLRANFAASLGSTKLNLSLVFAQVRGPNTIHTTVGFSGGLQFGDNGQVVWQITKDGASTSINVSASDIRLGAARVDARLNITAADGHVSGVNFLFGVAF